MGTTRPHLKDVSYNISAVCSGCGDTLLTRLVDKKYDAEGATRIQAKLGELFERHLAERHHAHEKSNCMGRTARL
jgi:hypothetical protein